MHLSVSEQLSMPSGPKKRRAELRKKNDTVSKTSTNPASHTFEETLAAPVEFDHQKTTETPMMVNDNIIVADTNTKKIEPNESDDVHDQLAMVNPPVINDTVEDTSLEQHDLSFLDSRGAVDACNSSEKPAMVKPDDSVCLKEPQDVLKEVSLVDQNKEVEVVKVLEQLVGVSAEIGFHAEKQVSLAKEFARLLEELKFGKLK